MFCASFCFRQLTTEDTEYTEVFVFIIQYIYKAEQVIDAQGQDYRL